MHPVSICGTPFSVNHAMVCHHGGLTFICHNELCDLTAAWLQEVCCNVAVEPPLFPLNGETIASVSANRTDEAHADVRATGFWGRCQGAFFDMVVYNHWWTGLVDWTTGLKFFFCF